MEVLRILSGGAVEGLLSRIAPTLKEQAGIAISGSFGAVGGMAARAKSGEAVDVLILTDSLIAELTAAGIADRDSWCDIGAVPTSIAARAGDAIPDVGTADALRAAFLAAPALFTPDIETATAGRHLVWMLDQMEIRDQVQPKLKIYPNGTAAIAAMTTCDIAGAIGCIQATEILATPGGRRVADLPREYALSTMYTAAVASKTAHPATAKALIALLARSPDRKAIGFLA